MDRQKLVRVLGMLGSDHDGERASAARMATQMLREAELTWDHVVFDPEAILLVKSALDEKDARIAHLEDICRTLTKPKIPNLSDHKLRAKECLESDDILSEWEIKFLRSFILGRFTTMTDRQLVVLERIEEKIDNADVT